jgi:hypothetical protein
MNVSRFLVAAVLVSAVSACSNDPAIDRESMPAESAPAPAATSGEQADGEHGEGVSETTPAAELPTPPRPAANVRRARPEPLVTQTAARDAREAENGPATQAAREVGVNTDAAVLADFKARVEKYIDIHKDAAKGDAKPRETESPAEIVARQEALAGRIRAARATAKQGDLFTAEIRTKFRRLLAPELKGEDGRDAKAVLKEDAPSPASIPFKVNAKYPEGAPLPSVPSNLLLTLPTLPAPLEYRIIGKHLVLLDTAAGIIVDFIPNAIP